MSPSRTTNRHRVIRRRRIVVAVVLVIGAALLGYSLTRPPGDESFYWLTLALAAVWAVGAFASGPLHLGCVRFRGRNQRPVITGTAVGLALGAVFVVGGLIAREIPGVREYITRVLEFANYGPLLLVTFITVVNGVAEEMFFRGALYTALGTRSPDPRLDGALRDRDVGHDGQPDARFRRDHPRHGVRVRAPSDRGSARTDADPFLLGSGPGARTAPDLRRLTQRMRQLVLAHPAPHTSRPPRTARARCRPPGRSSASKRLSTADRRSRTTPA